MSEIVRAGIISVDEGQTHAAQSLGMSRLQILRLIVLPQAMRVVIPPTGNETISMLKTTSLPLVAASYGELLFASQSIYSRQLQGDPAADRGKPLVLADDQRLVRRPVLHRAALRTRARRWERFDVGDRRLRFGLRAGDDRDGPSRGGAQAVRPPRGAARVSTWRSRRGEVMCLLGPSGSGKSTFLRASTTWRRSRGSPIGGRRARRLSPAGDKLYEMTSARSAQRRQIGMVFQHFNLFPHMTAIENVTEAPIGVEEGEARGGGRRRSRRALLDRSGSRQDSTPTRRSFPAVSSSVSRSPGRWRCGPN